MLDLRRPCIVLANQSTPFRKALGGTKCGVGFHSVPPRHEPITLNVNHDGSVRAYSQVVDLESFIPKEAQFLKVLLEAEGNELEGGGIPVPVIIRADRTVSYSEIMKIMHLCQSHGLVNIALSAMTRQETP